MLFVERNFIRFVSVSVICSVPRPYPAFVSVIHTHICVISVFVSYVRVLSVAHVYSMLHIYVFVCVSCHMSIFVSCVCIHVHVGESRGGRRREEGSRWSPAS